MRRKSLIAIASLSALSFCPLQAKAVFHEWEIDEIYSNADGSVQYIELATTFNGQHVVGAHVINATSDGITKTFTFPTNSPTGTTNKTLLIATPGFADLPGAVPPDFTLPCGPFFDPDATSITINFVGADSVTFAGATLPTDGTSSLNDNGGASLVSAAATPKNFAGTTGTLALTTCLINGTCEPCDDGLFCNGQESCAVAACVAGTACQEICDEGADTCVECDDPGDCDDQNPCTDDACNTGVCANTTNTAACDDGLFCTATDLCAAGACAGAGDPCAGQNCAEGLDACVDCVGPADCADGNPCTEDVCTAGTCSNPANDVACNDGSFCTVVDQCAGGVCVGSGDACPGQICDDVGDACLDCDDASDCDDGEECTNDACVAGACENTNVTLGTACESDDVFCNGLEQCVSGECQSQGDPCGGDTTCDEASATCILEGAGGSGGGPVAEGGSGPVAEGGGGPALEGGSGPTDVPTPGSSGEGSQTDTPSDSLVDDDDGCGCRVAGSSGSSAAWLGLLGWCALIVRRRRSARVA